MRFLSASPKSPSSNEEGELKKARRLFGTIYFVQGMGKLPEMSWNYFIKYQMKLSDIQGQVMDSLTGIGWYIKPLWGLVSDKYALFGYHHKSYLLLMPFLVSCAWFLLGLTIRMNFIFYAWVLILWNMGQVGYAFTDVVGDGRANILGKRFGQMASLVRLQWRNFALAALLVALVSGYVQGRIKSGIWGYHVIFFMTSPLSLLTAVMAYFSVDEERVVSPDPLAMLLKNAWERYGAPVKRIFFSVCVATCITGAFALSRLDHLSVWDTNSFSHLWKIIAALALLLSLIPLLSSISFRGVRTTQYRHLWYTALFMFFFGFSPSVGYIMFSFEEEVLKFEPHIFATIGFVSSVIFFISVVLFGRFVRRFPKVHWPSYLYFLVVLSVATLPLGFYYFVPENHWLVATLHFRLPWVQYIFNYFGYAWEAIAYMAYSSGLKILDVMRWVVSLFPVCETCGNALNYLIASLRDWGTGAITFCHSAFSYHFGSWNRFHWFSLINTVIFGLITIPGWLIPLTIAGEVTPKGKESTVYAMFMSLSNGAKFISAFFGGYIAFLFQWTGLGWFAYSRFDLAQTDNFRVLLLEVFIYIGAFASLMALPFIFLLNRELRRRGIEVRLYKKKES